MSSGLKGVALRRRCVWGPEEKLPLVTRTRCFRGGVSLCGLYVPFCFSWAITAEVTLVGMAGPWSGWLVWTAAI